MTLVKAQLNGLRMSPRKVRLLVGLIKRRSVAVAIDQLQHMTKRASGPLVKLIESAVANAVVQGVSREALVIKSLVVDKGLVLRRSMPRARGSASPIKKRSSHVVVELGTR